MPESTPPNDAAARQRVAAFEAAADEASRRALDERATVRATSEDEHALDGMRSRGPVVDLANALFHPWLSFDRTVLTRARVWALTICSALAIVGAIAEMAGAPFLFSLACYVVGFLGACLVVAGYRRRRSMD